MKNSLIIMKSFAIGACILTVLFARQSAGHIPNNDIKPILELFSLKWEGVEIPVRKTVSDSIWTLLDRLNCVQQGLSYQECVRCLNSAHVLKLVTDNNDTDTTLTTQENIQRLSVVLLNHVLNFRSACKKVDDNDRPSVCQDYVSCRNSLLANFQAIKIYTKQNVSTTKINRVGIKTGKEEIEESFYDKLVDILEVVLRRVKAVYQPLTFTDCFNAENLLSQLDIRENSTLKDKEVDFERLAILISKNILEGKCIDVGEAVTDFLEYLFNHYGNGSAHTIDKDGLATILRRLKNEKDDSHYHSHDHDHYHDHDHSQDNNHDHDHDHSHDNNHDHDHDHSHDNNHDHDHDHSHDNNYDHDHDHSHEHNHEYDNATSQMGSESKVPHKHRSKRDTNETENGHVHSRLTDKCLDVASLMDIFSHAPPKDTIGRAEFLQMCPALVQQAVSGVCKQTTKKERVPMTNMELYGYSTIAVLIISLASLVVVVILPVINKRIYQYVMMSMIGLGFGTMAGDAFLHLIPAGLGLHSHDHDDHDHSHDEIEIPPYLYQQLAVLAAIYGIFLFESLLEIFIGGQSHGDGSHGHTHVPQQIPNPLAKKSNPKTDSVIELASCNDSTLTLDADNPDKNENSNLEPVFKAPALICGLTSLAIVITVADTIHNIGDGLAIGAAYSSSVQSGLSTSIAVLCHELPHEFGDFVILLSTGLSFKKALFINFMSALSCFIGLYIGIVFGEDEIARQWMLIVTAGIFLYVALSEMLPELKQNKMGSKYKMFFVKNFGILLGLGLMVVIAIYEEKITI